MLRDALLAWAPLPGRRAGRQTPDGPVVLAEADLAVLAGATPDQLAAWREGGWPLTLLAVPHDWMRATCFAAGRLDVLRRAEGAGPFVADIEAALREAPEPEVRELADGGGPEWLRGHARALADGSLSYEPAERVRWAVVADLVAEVRWEGRLRAAWAALPRRIGSLGDWADRLRDLVGVASERPDRFPVRRPAAWDRLVRGAAARRPVTPDPEWLAEMLTVWSP